ncbi:MAG: hypothetical protein II644_08260 [Paludibacteraceae bacterium]|nr:hypothetical protein [Paludibacteraceae bacterium]
MAKVHIPTGYTWRQVAEQLKTIGVTLDGHQLPDGTYRAYVRKKNLNLFINNLNPSTPAGGETWSAENGKSRMG